MEEGLKCYVCSILGLDTDAVMQMEAREGLMPLCDHCMSIYESLIKIGALDCLEDINENGDKT